MSKAITIIKYFYHHNDAMIAAHKVLNKARLDLWKSAFVILILKSGNTGFAFSSVEGLQRHFTSIGSY